MLVDYELTKYISKSKSFQEDTNFKYPLDFYMTSSNDPPAHQFFSEFKPLLYALAVTGQFPFHRDSEKRLKCCLWSMGGLYWAAVYSLINIIAYDMLDMSFAQIFGCHNFEEVMIALRNCSLLLVHILQPLNWPGEWRMLACYINEWDEFLVDWGRLTGKALLTGLRWKFVLRTIIYPFLVAGILFYEKETLGLKASGWFLYWWILCGGFFHSTVFIITLSVTQKVSDDLKLNLVGVVEKSKKRVGVCVMDVQKLKYLWVRGSDLLVKSGHAMGQSCLIIYLVNVVWVVISLYGYIKTMINFEFHKAFHHFSLAVVCSLYVIIGCEMGHRATRKMRADIIATLASIDVSGLNEMTAREACSHIITYLIVLVQFKTADIDIKRSNNTTSV